MNELINKTVAMRRLKAAYDGSVAVHGDNDNLFADGIDYAMDIIGHIKAVDAVPVIRCKDCLYSRGLDRNDPHDDRYADGQLWCRKLCEDVCPVNYCSKASRRE